MDYCEIKNLTEAEDVKGKSMVKIAKKNSYAKVMTF